MKKKYLLVCLCGFIVLSSFAYKKKTIYFTITNHTAHSFRAAISQFGCTKECSYGFSSQYPITMCCESFAVGPYSAIQYKRSMVENGQPVKLLFGPPEMKGWYKCPMHMRAANDTKWVFDPKSKYQKCISVHLISRNITFVVYKDMPHE